MKIGLPGLLFVVFLVLKLTEVITWSWWWVTAPLWGLPIVVVVIWLLIYAFGLLLTFWQVKQRNKAFKK